MLKQKNFIASTTKLVSTYRNDGSNRIIIPITDEEQSITYYINYLKECSSKYQTFLYNIKTITTDNL